METKKEIVSILLTLAEEQIDTNLISITEENKLRVFLKNRKTILNPNGLGDSYIGTFILGEDVAHIYLISYLGDELSYTYRTTSKTLYISKENVPVKKIELAEPIKLNQLTLEKAKDITRYQNKENYLVKKKRFQIQIHK